MTQQEFVKKESEKIETSRSSYLCAGAFAEGNRIGLSKGLDISMRFAEWVNDYFVAVVGHDGCFHKVDELFMSNPHKCERHSTEELLEIFLTEKYGQ